MILTRDMVVALAYGGVMANAHGLASLAASGSSGAGFCRRRISRLTAAPGKATRSTGQSPGRAWQVAQSGRLDCVMGVFPVFKREIRRWIHVPLPGQEVALGRDRPASCGPLQCLARASGEWRRASAYFRDDGTVNSSGHGCGWRPVDKPRP